MHVESDLVDTRDPEIIDAIKRGQEERIEFLCDVFRAAPCLGRLKPKLSKFQVLLTELFSREVSEAPDVNQENSNLRETNPPREQSVSDRVESPSGSREIDEHSRDKWRAVYDRFNDELQFYPNCHEKARDSLYRAREQYIRFRNRERGKFAPNPVLEGIQTKLQSEVLTSFGNKSKSMFKKKKN